MVADHEDIRESLMILLATQVGERLLDPRFGCDLQRYVYEPLSATLKAQIRELVERSILYFEARIKVDRVDVCVDNLEGRLELELHYTVPATNSRHNLVFPFYQVEGAVQP